jgi:hypothetical protein
VKEDPNGRHTFEDGTVYAGPFINDVMVNYRKESIPGKTIPGKNTANIGNIGGEDNPVRKCIDIEDLQSFLKGSEQIAGADEGGVLGGKTAQGTGLHGAMALSEEIDIAAQGTGLHGAMALNEEIDYLILWKK